jgi:hypothetical protein
MDPIYMQNITEIRNEYTTFLTNILTPFIYEGIKSTYSYAVNVHNEFIEKGKHDPTIKSPGVLKLFQLTLKEIPTLNSNAIDAETTRIKSQCKCADWFDDLVRAVVKSNIILLTFSNPKRRPEIMKEEYHNKIDIRDFIHKCYIEGARTVYNNPELFWHEYPTLEIKRNQREACDLIRKAICEAIRRMLPIKLILKEYLQNNFEDDDNDITKPMSEGNYMKIQSMLNRDLHGLNIPQRNESVLEDENKEDYMKDEDENGEINELENNIHKLEQQFGGDDDKETEDEDYLDDDDSEAIGGNVDEDEGGDVYENIKRQLEKETQKLENIPVSREQLKENPKEEPKEKPSEKSPEIPKATTEAGTNSIPRAEKDTEVKRLIEGNKAVLNIEQPKKKLNKREQQLFDELEKKEKDQNVDKKKLYFENYMK